MTGPCQPGDMGNAPTARAGNLPFEKTGFDQALNMLVDGRFVVVVVGKPEGSGFVVCSCGRKTRLGWSARIQPENGDMLREQALADVRKFSFTTNHKA